MGYVIGLLIVAGIVALVIKRRGSKKATGSGGRPGDPQTPGPQK